MALDPQAQVALSSAIGTALGDPIVTRYVVVAEVITEDGEQVLADLTSPGLPHWDATGMLTAAAQGRAAQPAWSAES